MVLVDVCAAARFVPFLDQGGVNACGLEADGQRQTAEAAADHGCSWTIHDAPSMFGVVALDLGRRCSRRQRRARRIGTGGLPVNNRTLSDHSNRPP